MNLSKLAFLSYKVRIMPYFIGYFFYYIIGITPLQRVLVKIE